MKIDLTKKGEAPFGGELPDLPKFFRWIVDFCSWEGFGFVGFGLVF